MGVSPISLNQASSSNVSTSVTSSSQPQSANCQPPRTRAYTHHRGGERFRLEASDVDTLDSTNGDSESFSVGTFRAVEETDEIGGSGWASGFQNRMQRCLGKRQLLGYIMSSTLGSGAYISLGQMAYIVNSYVVLTTVLAGLNAMLAGLAYAEFASLYPNIGTAYSYAYVTMGELPAWFLGWLIVGAWACTAGLIGALFANYVSACK